MGPRVIIERVKTFFEEIKRRLGRECRGTIFDLPGKLAALACGVSEATVYRVAKTQAGMVHRPIPRTKHVDRNPRQRKRDAVQKYGDQWGSVVRHFIHDKLRAERNITVEDAWKELSEIHEGFRMSQTEFFYLLKGLHFSYRQNDRQAFIFECPSIVRKRTAYLDAIERARSENHCLVFMDETWVFDCMSSKRGWNDTSIPRFAPAATMQEFSCGGRTMAKNKGRRAIVISDHLTDECVVPGSTKVIVSGRRSVDDDYHRDMNAEIFEEWLRETVPHMVSVANGRCVSLVMDNASYHSRQLQKIPTKSSTKAVIVDYLRSNGMTVAHNIRKEDLVKELDDFITSRGGLSALRRYATESICAEHGVAVIRLPPYHCFFNPIELCWSQLKGHLCKLGRPGDTLETVRTRALEWMAGVPLEFCAGWSSHTMKEEIAARNKLVADLHEVDEDEDESSDGELEDEDPRDERGGELEAGVGRKGFNLIRYQHDDALR
ncbi:unnamed protein product [Cylicocyclus nassatus]|uniref:Tc1-like transposase DDE domain-containing protein n=1 Tax=Cylicocyclus nassatus TaxID=53992 RepID=A0AA36HDE9_CYLNA|nr:unnamed protein product [Cylicocyclus nassatus]